MTSDTNPDTTKRGRPHRTKPIEERPIAADMFEDATTGVGELLRKYAPDVPTSIARAPFGLDDLLILAWVLDQEYWSNGQPITALDTLVRVVDKINDITHRTIETHMRKLNAEHRRLNDDIARSRSFDVPSRA